MDGSFMVLFSTKNKKQKKQANTCDRSSSFSVVSLFQHKEGSTEHEHAQPKKEKSDQQNFGEQCTNRRP
jgi:hypothetical protein